MGNPEQLISSIKLNLEKSGSASLNPCVTPPCVTSGPKTQSRTGQSQFSLQTDALRTTGTADKAGSTPQSTPMPSVPKTGAARAVNLISFLGLNIKDVSPNVKFTPRALELGAQLEDELGPKSEPLAQQVG